MRLDAADLARWTRFAGKGGIGKCTATTDCVAESEDDLMFLKDDEIIVLFQIPEKEGLYLGYCEGVVGRFHGTDVQFHGRLKKPVITKRSSVSTTSSTKSPTPYQTVSSPSPVPPSRPGSTSLRVQAQIPARADALTPNNTNTDQRHHPPSLSFSSASAASDSAVSTPAIAQFPAGSSTNPERYIPSPLNLFPEPTSPLRISKKTPTSPPPDTSYSTFDDHANRLDVGNDTEVGIGLSLLQGLVGDDSSDDDDDDEFSASPRAARNSKQNRDSVSGSQEGTVEGLDYTKPDVHLSPHTSPTSPSFHSERERRPSLAASATSSSSWEGASDIYDNYRYSRYERSRTDSLASSSRPRTDSNTTKSSIHQRHTTATTATTTKPPPTRTMSVDSDASVYTRDSRLSSLSKDARQLLSQAQTQNESLQNRPEPLDEEPLLHTNWGSPFSSPGLSGSEEPKSSGILHTPIPGQVRSFEAALGLSSSSKSPPLSSSPPQPSQSPGLASSVRQRVEKRLSDDTIHTRHSGLGTRIVVEDDEEIPSRVGLSDSPDPEADISTLSTSIILNHLPPTLGTPPRRSSPSLAGSIPSSPPPPSTQVETSPTPRPSRISLADLREPTGPIVPGSANRQSLFLPHPNAPKPPPSTQASRGPMYVQQQQNGGPGMNPNVPPNASSPPPPNSLHPHPPHQAPLSHAPNNGPSPNPNPIINPIHDTRLSGFPLPPPSLPPSQMRPNVIGVMRMALSHPPRPGGRGPTIYGRTEVDLGSATGPVPVIWSVDPPGGNGATKPPGVQGQGMVMGAGPGPGVGPGMGVGGGMAGGGAPGPGPAPSRPAPPPNGMGGPQGAFPPLGPGLALGNRATMPARPTVRSSSLSVPAPPNVAGGLGGGSGGGGNVEAEGGAGGAGAGGGSGQKGDGSKLIPRANFTPKTPGARPRSRSFSSFSSDPEPSSKPLAKSSPLRPSPLSLPPTTRSSLPGVAAGLNAKPPNSPLAQSVAVPPPPIGATATNSPLPSPGFIPNLSGRTLRHSSSRATLNDVSSLSGSVSRPSLTQLRAGGSNSALSTGAPTASTTTTEPTSPVTSVTRVPSLRAKLSLPNLRRKQSRPDDISVGGGGLGGGDLISPIQESPAAAAAQTAEMLQVQDMEFELVRPTGLWNQAARASEDSNVLGRDTSIDILPSPGGPGGGGLGGSGAIATPPASAGVTGGFLRPESPAISIVSSAAPSVVSSFAGGRGGAATGTDSESGTTNASSMEAHRARELKWLTLISSSPASNARKNKKVKKLIMEGVPNSVRYPVWSYLADGKAKCVPGVYDQLCKRGKVPHTPQIEKDVEQYFVDQQGSLSHYLHGTKGSVVTLLQAYFNMVPDVQYLMGLTLIMGQLVLVAPEEEAFWIFVSVMDTHVRGYFAMGPTCMQMEVDAALFAKALEGNDSQVGKKVLTELGVNPVAVCERWFTTLFVGVLPQEYVCRIWDHFLYEGIPFLMRVGLAAISCLRQPILASSSEESLLSVLHYPPISALPSSPDAFISLAYSMKLKDDDVRKQRVKMEAQLKRQTQTQQQQQGGSVVSRVTGGASISLPR